MSTLTLRLERAPHDGPRFARTRAAFAALRRGTSVTLTAATAPHKAALRRLLEMPLTVVATGFVDTAAWAAPHWVGWLVTGLSLLAIEHLISDDDDSGRPA